MKKYKKCSRLIVFQLLVLHLFPASVFAVDKPTLDVNSQSKETSAHSEYFNANRDKRLMVKVSLLSGVPKPGIHYIPDDTNLLDMLSMAGGILSYAKEDEIMLQRTSKTNSQLVAYDLHVMMKTERNKIPILLDNDIIYIPEKPSLRGDIMQNLAFYSVILAAITGTVAIINLATSKK